MKQKNKPSPMPATIVKGLICFDCAGVIHVWPMLTEKYRDMVQRELDRNTMPREMFRTKYGEVTP